VLIPLSNEKDLPDIPSLVREALTITPVRHMDEVLEHALIRADNQPIFQTPLAVDGAVSTEKNKVSPEPVSVPPPPSGK
jgi:ATP-dependent Lon protease